MVSSSYSTTSLQILTEAAQPSLYWSDSWVILSNTAFPAFFAASCEG